MPSRWQSPPSSWAGAVDVSESAHRGVRLVACVCHNRYVDTASNEGANLKVLATLTTLPVSIRSLVAQPEDSGNC